jgi:hypothetical protein
VENFPGFRDGITAVDPTGGTKTVTDTAGTGRAATAAALRDGRGPPRGRAGSPRAAAGRRQGRTRPGGRITLRQPLRPRAAQPLPTPAT